MHLKNQKQKTRNQKLTEHLRLRSRTAKAQGDLKFFQVFNGAIDRLVAADVFGKCFHESFGMLGREDDTGLHFAFRGPRHHVYKVDDEFGVGVCDDGKIGIGAFCYLFGYFDIDLILGLWLIAHEYVFYPLAEDTAKDMQNSP